MLYSFQAMLANFEYKQIKKRLSRGRLAAAEQGKWTNSNKAPLGYKKDTYYKDLDLGIAERELHFLMELYEIYEREFELLKTELPRKFLSF
ncbi:DNA invertase Pin-like site-specific DNA recombinase [Neobacillus niacini]|uniref:hypothetical protein n=1 Tax=Neobacillus driksii TaxID=3035913 RepID=UPI002782FD1F|nr:hypothetical protein [Neobacillus niacini]MDQ0971178.1 DNA invertase Pin-like site-specific DNA recombinase [Neobacillus niacini]